MTAPAPAFDSEQDAIDHLAVDELEQDVQGHQNKAMVFDYFAAHLFDEDYTLKEDDLIRLEILARYG